MTDEKITADDQRKIDRINRKGPRDKANGEYYGPWLRPMTERKRVRKAAKAARKENR